LLSPSKEACLWFSCHCLTILVLSPSWLPKGQEAQELHIWLVWSQPLSLVLKCFQGSFLAFHQEPFTLTLLTGA
jgi:hypothetical protein